MYTLYPSFWLSLRILNAILQAEVYWCISASGNIGYCKCNANFYRSLLTWLHIYVTKSYLINLPTLISKFLNRSGQPHSDPLLTMYTSDTCSTCCRSTLHQGLSVLRVIVHDPFGSPYRKWVLLFPSTALELLPYL